MSITLYLPAIVCVIGLVIYAITNNAKTSEIGRIMFAFGLLASLLTLGTGK